MSNMSERLRVNSRMMELPTTRSDMQQLNLSYELSTSSRARVRAWFRSIRAPRLICELLRTYWAKLVYGVVTATRFLRRKIRSVCVRENLAQVMLWSLGVCVMAGVISIVFSDYLQGTGHHMTYTNQFEALQGYTLPDNNVSIVSSDPLGICLKDSGENRTIVFDSAPFTSNRCHRLEHTLFYYDITPELKKSSTIYIRRSALNAGKRHDDGFFYYIASFPSPARLSDAICQRYSDFYRLALHENRTDIVGLARRHMDPYGNHYLGVLIQSLAPACASEDTCMAGSYDGYVKQYVRVHETSVQYNVGPNTLGYGLCQGDPFNLVNDSASLFRKSLRWEFPPRSVIDQTNDLRIQQHDEMLYD